MQCRISGYLYNAAGVAVKAGLLTIRLQQDIVSVEGQKIAPITVTQRLDALAAPTLVSGAPQGTPGSTNRFYYVAAVDGNGGVSLTGLCQVAAGAAILTPTNFNHISWAAVPYAKSYLIYNTVGVTIGSTTAIFWDDAGAIIGNPHPGINTSGGFVDVSLVATVGATPANVAYFVEYDPDPDNNDSPSRSKDGYWNNYWAVPNTTSAALGNFVSALRGAPSFNYMPLGGSASNFGDNLVIGGVPAATNKAITANQTSGGNPQIRFNASIGIWEITNNGSVYFAIPSAAATFSVYTHTQAAPSTSWTVVHGKGKGAVVVVTDALDNVIIPGGVNYSNPNAAILTFTTAQAGFAYVR